VKVCCVLDWYATLKVIEIVSITYCVATNPGCGCEDDAAIPVTGEKSNHQIDADGAMADYREPVG